MELQTGRNDAVKEFAMIDDTVSMVPRDATLGTVRLATEIS